MEQRIRRRLIWIKKIAEMICVDQRPYSCVEDAGFLRVLKAADSRYNIPKEKVFRTSMIPEISKKIENKIEVHLNQMKELNQKFSFTTDIWSSRGNDSYISLSCHFVDHNFCRQNMMLNASVFNEDHTAENIALKVQEMINKWGLSIENTFMIVRDNAPNMKAAFRQIEIDRKSTRLNSSHRSLSRMPSSA